jgi:rhomboid protease GluP
MAGKIKDFIPSKQDSLKEMLKYVPVSTSIIAVNILVWLVMFCCGVNLFTANGYTYMKWGANFAPLTLTGDWWRLITSSFIHQGVFHLLLNMFWFFLFGFISEIVYRPRRFLFAYFYSAIFSAYFSLIFHTDAPCLRASGAVYGCFGLCISAFLLHEGMNGNRKETIFAFLPFLAYGLFYGLIKKNIDLAAHVGGLLSGFVLGICYEILIRIVPKEKLSRAQGILELSFLVLFIYLFGNMVSNAPTKYIQMRRLWDSGVVEKMMEQKKQRKN